MTPLSAISTQWSLLDKIRSSDAATAREALGILFLRYSPAIYRYALSILHDKDAAETVRSNFATQLAEHKFDHVCQENNSFRQLLKRVTKDLALDYLRKQDALREQPLAEIVGQETTFDEECRRILLDRAWRALEEDEARDGWPPLYTLLLWGGSNKDASHADLASQLSERSKETVNAEQVKCWLDDARGRFANHLIDILAEEIGEDDLVSELRNLELFRYCKSALEASGRLSA